MTTVDLTKNSSSLHHHNEGVENDSAPILNQNKTLPNNDDEEKTMAFNPDTHDQHHGQHQQNQNHLEDIANGVDIQVQDQDQDHVMEEDDSAIPASITTTDLPPIIQDDGLVGDAANGMAAGDHLNDNMHSGISVVNSLLSATSDPHQSAFAMIPTTIESVTVKTDDDQAQQQHQDPEVEEEPTRDPLLVREQFKWFSKTIQAFKKKKEAPLFLVPVDPVALRIPNYFDVIKQPMDVSTIEKKLNSLQYTLADEGVADFNLMLQNCFTFNGTDPVANPVAQLALTCNGWFQKEVLKMPRTYADALAAAQKKKPGRPSDAGIGIRSSLTRSNTDLDHGKRRLAAVAATKKSGPELKFCGHIHRECLKKGNADFTWPFIAPVDYVALNIPTYPQIIKYPMDLATIKKKLDVGEYSSADDFEADFRLMLDNCFKFNSVGTSIHDLGRRLERWFNIKWNEKGSFLNQHGETRLKTNSHNYDEGDDTDDESYNTQMSNLRAQLDLTQKMINSLIESKRREKERRRQSFTATSAQSYVSATTASAAAALTYLPPSQPAASYAAKSQAKPKKGPSKPRGRKKRVHASSDDERMPDTDITYEQKRELSDNINILPPDKLPQVFEIIKENANFAGVDEEEIELDIDSLEKPVLWKLYLFVKKHTRPPKKAKYDEQGAEIAAVGADASSSSEAESDESGSNSD